MHTLASIVSEQFEEGERYEKPYTAVVNFDDGVEPYAQLQYH